MPAALSLLHALEAEVGSLIGSAEGLAFADWTECRCGGWRYSGGGCDYCVQGFEDNVL